MLNLAFGLIVFLLVSQAYSQEIQTQDVTSAPPVVVAPNSEEKIDALQQQMLLLQSQINQMNLQNQKSLEAKKIEAQAVPVPQVVVPVATLASEAVPTSPNSIDLDPYKNLRSRKQALTWRYAYNYEKHKATSPGYTGSSTVDANSTEYEFEYAINLSMIEGGVRVNAVRKEDDDGDQSVYADVGLVGRLNFVENRPGNDFIPYVAGYLGGVSINYDGSSNYSVDGGYAGLGVGFNWFPFSQIFALNLELSHFSAGLESDTNPKIMTDSINTRLNVGWRIYF